MLPCLAWCRKWFPAGRGNRRNRWWRCEVPGHPPPAADALPTWSWNPRDSHSRSDGCPPGDEIAVMSDICSTQSCCNPHHLYTSSHVHTVSVSKSQTCPNQSIANQAIPSCWGMQAQAVTVNKPKTDFGLFYLLSSQHAGGCCPFPRALSFNSFIASSGAMGGSIVVRTCRSTGWEHRFMASVSWLMKEAMTSVPCWLAPHLETSGLPENSHLGRFLEGHKSLSDFTLCKFKSSWKASYWGLHVEARRLRLLGHARIEQMLGCKFRHQIDSW